METEELREAIIEEARTENEEKGGNFDSQRPLPKLFGLRKGLGGCRLSDASVV